jgi:hypothetical protein
VLVIESHPAQFDDLGTFGKCGFTIMKEWAFSIQTTNPLAEKL